MSEHRRDRNPDEEEGKEKHREANGEASGRPAGARGGAAGPQGNPSNPPSRIRTVRLANGSQKTRHDFPLGVYEISADLLAWGRQVATALRATADGSQAGWHAYQGDDDVPALEDVPRPAESNGEDRADGVPPLADRSPPAKRDKGKQRQELSDTATPGGSRDAGKTEPEPEPAKAMKLLQKQARQRKTAISNMFQAFCRREPNEHELSEWMRRAEAISDDYDRLAGEIQIALSPQARGSGAVEQGESSSAPTRQQSRDPASRPQPNKGLRPPSVTEAEEERRREIGDYMSLDPVPPPDTGEPPATKPKEKPEASWLEKRRRKAEATRRFNEQFVRFPPHPDDGKDDEGGVST